MRPPSSRWNGVTPGPQANIGLPEVAGPLMAAKKELILRFSEAAEWDAWLARNHDRSGAVWLRIPKRKGSDVTYARALDTALAWGWIDSQKRALDASAWLQRFS